MDFISNINESYYYWIVKILMAIKAARIAILNLHRNNFSAAGGKNLSHYCKV